VYFTWPDRRFRYQCRGCGACCKGHGIGIDVAGGQLVQLLARRPALAAFLRRRGDAITAFNPRDRCWFLADDGLCRIEVDDGRAAKPASCRLFPFNRIFRLGPYTIVDYNSVICPLHVADDALAAALETRLATLPEAAGEALLVLDLAAAAGVRLDLGPAQVQAFAPSSSCWTHNQVPPASGAALRRFTLKRAQGDKPLRFLPLTSFPAKSFEREGTTCAPAPAIRQVRAKADSVSAWPYVSPDNGALPRGYKQRIHNAVE